MIFSNQPRTDTDAEISISEYRSSYYNCIPYIQNIKEDVEHLLEIKLLEVKNTMYEMQSTLDGMRVLTAD